MFSFLYFFSLLWLFFFFFFFSLGLMRDFLSSASQRVTVSVNSLQCPSVQESMNLIYNLYFWYLLRTNVQFRPASVSSRTLNCSKKKRRRNLVRQKAASRGVKVFPGVSRARRLLPLSFFYFCFYFFLPLRQTPCLWRGHLALKFIERWYHDFL